MAVKTATGLTERQIVTDIVLQCDTFRSQTGGLGINPEVFFAVIFYFKQLCIKELTSRMNTKKVSSVP